MENSWLVSSVGRTLHRYHGFKSRTGLNFFQAFFSPLPKQCTLRRGSLSFTSLSAVQIYDFHIFLTVCCYCYCCYICITRICLFFSVETRLHIFASNCTSTRQMVSICIHYPTLNVQYLSTGANFWTTKQSRERSNQSRTTFNPELKFATLSEYNLLASTSPGKGVISR